MRNALSSSLSACVCSLLLVFTASASNVTSCRRSIGSDLLQRRAKVSEAQVTFVSVNGCQAQCVIPEGEKWLLDASLQVETLTIHGTLEWDLTKQNLELRANYILVETGGRFVLGTADSPMNFPATIYITKGASSDPELGRRFLGGRGTAQTLGNEVTWKKLNTTQRGRPSIKICHICLQSISLYYESSY